MCTHHKTGPKIERFQSVSLDGHPETEHLTIWKLYWSGIWITVGIRLPDMSGNQKVKTCPIAEWSADISSHPPDKPKLVQYAR